MSWKEKLGYTIGDTVLVIEYDETQAFPYYVKSVEVEEIIKHSDYCISANTKLYPRDRVYTDFKDARLMAYKLNKIKESGRND